MYIVAQYIIYVILIRMKKYSGYKQKLLSDKVIKREYENLSPQFEVVRAIIKKRLQKGMSQKELAHKMGTRQSAVSRFESGSYNPSLSFLQRITEALDANIKITVR